MCATAFLFTMGANDLGPRLRGAARNRTDAAPVSNSSVRPSVRPARARCPVPFFSCFSTGPSESLSPAIRPRPLLTL